MTFRVEKGPAGERYDGSERGEKRRKWERGNKNKNRQQKKNTEKKIMGKSSEEVRWRGGDGCLIFSSQLSFLCRGLLVCLHPRLRSFDCQEGWERGGDREMESTSAGVWRLAGTTRTLGSLVGDGLTGARSASCEWIV